MKTSPRRRKHRRRAFRRLFWLLVLATLLLLLWPRRATLDGLNSPHAILLQADSGEVLAEKDADSTIYPASMTKMMTALLAIEANPDLDTPVTLPEEIFPSLQAQNASLAGFQAGETATVRDLLYGAMLPSGAECCEALAREVSGSEEAFAARMNQKAAELGMTGTHFCNPTGLHALMAELGADPAATLFVGDSDVDILTGHNAQLPAMGALWGFRGRAELTAAGADALAEVPEDILRYVQEQNK